MGEQVRSGVSLEIAGLFAGIGGIESGLHRAGHRTRLLCEIDPGARAVLESRFPGIECVEDVAEIDALPPEVDVLTGGFPCQDLSQAGTTRGMSGDESSLVAHVFRILEASAVQWVLLENVPFMLQLHRGAAMRYVLDAFEGLGYRWAYRVVDTRSFGIPQRRERVFLLASRSEEPSEYLFADDKGPPLDLGHEGRACGFYWTEGTRGLGWAVDCVPTLKGGSGLGIPSPPAIWFPDGRIVTPHLDDAERLQGFPAGWTEPAEKVVRHTARWKLVGNAVTVDVAEWIGELLGREPRGLRAFHLPLSGQAPLPKAAFGSREGRFAVEVSTRPVENPNECLAEFLRREPRPLSERATRGFRARLVKGSLRCYPEEFLEAIEAHLSSFSGHVDDVAMAR